MSERILNSVETISLDRTWFLINEEKNIHLECSVPGTVFVPVFCQVFLFDLCGTMF